MSDGIGKKVNLGRRGKTGETGLRGATGQRGATGPRGVIGKQGRKGVRGLEGLEGLRGPDHKDDVLDNVVLHFQDVYQELAVLTKQIARMERKLHGTGATRRRRAKG